MVEKAWFLGSITFSLKLGYELLVIRHEYLKRKEIGNSIWLWEYFLSGRKGFVLYQQLVSSILNVLGRPKTLEIYIQ